MSKPHVSAALCTVAAAALNIGCDWTEFDPLESEAPVVALEKSSDINGPFGHMLASGTEGNDVVLLVGGVAGVSRAAGYSLGREQDPGVDASYGGFCSTRDRIESCELANSAAYLRLEDRDGDEQMCFAYGWGQVEGSNEGVLVRCLDKQDDSLPAPRAAVSERERDSDLSNAFQPLLLASDRSSSPVVLAALPNQRAAWFYPAGSRAPVELFMPPNTSPPPSFGEQVAVLALGDEGPRRVFAVAAPERGGVWLFRTDDGEEVIPTGCLGEFDGFGQALAGGDVDGDGNDDLVVADGTYVTVFSGAQLGRFTEAAYGACGLGSLPEDTIIASFGCGSREAAKGCEDSGFGASLAVADLDGDDDGEVLVGAPEMTIYGVRDAGAVLVYDAEGNAPEELADLYFVASAEGGDRLGSSVVAVRQRQRDIVVAGAPGGSKTMIFYCSDLLDEADRTGRCAP